MSSLVYFLIFPLQLRVCISKALRHGLRVTARLQYHTEIKSSGVASYGTLGHMPPSTSNNFIFSSLWSKSDSQLSKYCVVCEISWCRCQQLTALSISTALGTKLLVIKQLLHPGLKSTVSAQWHNVQLCPSSPLILATPLIKSGTLMMKAQLAKTSWI